VMPASRATNQIRNPHITHHQSHMDAAALDRYTAPNENSGRSRIGDPGARSAPKRPPTRHWPTSRGLSLSVLRRRGCQRRSPWLVAALVLQTQPVLDNAHVRVSRNAAPCASPTAECRHRIFVALGEVLLASYWQGREFEGPNLRKLRRGDVVVYGPRDSYSPPTEGDFLEVTVKSARPAIASPPVIIPPDKNSILHDADEFFVFEEKLDPGDTRARHSHRERVVIVLNQTRLQQWPEGAPELFRDQIPDDVRFNPPVVHVVKTVGAQPLRNIVIEFKK
jgi:hypothetical protein